MTELEDDLRAISEDIAADAEELEDIEGEKARLEPDDPRRPRLARDGERIARGIVPKTVAEKKLADDLAAEAERRKERPN